MNTLTHSQIHAFDCPRKYYWRYVERLRPIEKSEALFIGSLFHEGREKGEEFVVEKIRALPMFGQFDADKNMKLEALVVGMLRGASLAFKDYDIEREPEWDLPLRNPETGRASRRFRIAGKADGWMVDDLGIGIIVEEKTTSRINEADISKLDLDQQVLNEVSNLQRLKKTTVGTVVYRYILKPHIKQTQKETVEQFCDRLIDDYQTRTDFYFQQFDLLVDQGRVREWEKDLWQIAHTIGYAKNHNLWYKNTSRCAEWSGCSYLPLCRGEDAMHLYEKTEVNPELGEGNNGVAHNE